MSGLIFVAQGLLNLTACAASEPTSELISFSSTAAVLGPSGQANYAAANAAVNAWTSARQAAGNSGTAIMWGAWTIGMAAQKRAILARLERLGMGSITPEAGLLALEAIIGSSRRLPQVCVGRLFRSVHHCPCPSYLTRLLSIMLEH